MREEQCSVCGAEESTGTIISLRMIRGQIYKICNWCYLNMQNNLENKIKIGGKKCIQ